MTSNVWVPSLVLATLGVSLTVATCINIRLYRQECQQIDAEVLAKETSLQKQKEELSEAIKANTLHRPYAPLTQDKAPLLLHKIVSQDFSENKYKKRDGL